MAETGRALYIASHPLRLRILRFLRDKPRSAEKLAEDLKLSPSLTYFHLLTLKQYGLVDTRYALGNPSTDPRAVHEFVLTDEASDVVKRLESALSH